MESFSLESATILKYFYSITTGDNWGSILDAVDALDMPLEQILPRVEELVSKGYLDYRTGTREASQTLLKLERWSPDER